MKEIIVEETFNTPIEKVWQAITDIAQMKKWYFDLAEFKPEVGFEFNFEGQTESRKKYQHICKITDVIPNQKLQYSWAYENIIGSTLLTFDLSTKGDTTQLKLSHTGFDSFPKNNPDLKPEILKQVGYI